MIMLATYSAVCLTSIRSHPSQPRSPIWLKIISPRQVLVSGLEREQQALFQLGVEALSHHQILRILCPDNGVASAHVRAISAECASW